MAASAYRFGHYKHCFHYACPAQQAELVLQNDDQIMDKGSTSAITQQKQEKAQFPPLLLSLDNVGTTGITVETLYTSQSTFFIVFIIHKI